MCTPALTRLSGWVAFARAKHTYTYISVPVGQVDNPPAHACLLYVNPNTHGPEYIIRQEGQEENNILKFVIFLFLTYSFTRVSIHLGLIG